MREDAFKTCIRNVTDIAVVSYLNQLVTPSPVNW